jgi:hypothetical protein
MFRVPELQYALAPDVNPMDPRHLVGMDERLKINACIYCGGNPSTRDHVPSKVFLDEPYPPGLPVVGACETCNVGFSLDEQYLACFIECVICGTDEPAGLRRLKIQRILASNTELKRRLCVSKRQQGDTLHWVPEADRVRNVFVKLARSHAVYELFPVFGDPDRFECAPLMLMQPQQRTEFENGPLGAYAPWPEIGSRAFYRAAGVKVDAFAQSGDWIVVQPDRYRFAVNEIGGVEVLIVLSEYLGCIVSWD